MEATALNNPAATGVNLVADEITQYAHKSWNELFGMSRLEAELFQLRAARRRFEELAPQIGALKEQADRNRVTRIGSLDDLVPLLFNHTVLKSYPISLLERNRFDLLTRWFDRLTPIDLSGVDVSGCVGIDDWLSVLEKETPLQIFHTTGTSGKLSFLPRTSLESDLWGATMLKYIREPFGDPPNAASRGPDLRLPVIYPSNRYGRYTNQRMLDYLARHFAPAPARVYCLSDATLSADVVSLSGRIRVAQAKGELSKMKFSDAQREALKRYFQELERRPQEATEFFARLANELRGQRVYLTSQSSLLFSAAREGIARHLRGVFSSDSIGLHGGGSKGTVLPPDWKDSIVEFTGIPHENWAPLTYGMTELTGPMSGCTENYSHIPPYIIPFLLDPTTGAVLPREGRQTGRFAALDLLAQNLWGGVITGDKLTIEWDRDCGCGRKGAHIHDGIERYADAVTGDDKVTCSATVDNTDAALQSLLGI